MIAFDEQKKVSLVTKGEQELGYWGGLTRQPSFARAIGTPSSQQQVETGLTTTPPPPYVALP